MGIQRALSLFFTGLTLLLPHLHASAVAEAWQSYMHSAPAFLISYPPDWHLTKMSGPIHVSVQAPVQPPVLVRVMSANVKEIGDVERFLKRSAEAFWQGRHRGKPIWSERVTIGRHPALIDSALYPVPGSDIKLQVTQLLVPANQRLFTVAGANQFGSPRFEEHNTLIKAIVLTFRPLER